MLAVERLRPEPRHPIDQVFQQPGHGPVVLRRGDDEPVGRVEPATQLRGAGWKALPRLRILIVGGSIQRAHRGEINRPALSLDRAGGEFGKRRIEGASPERRREHQETDRLALLGHGRNVGALGGRGKRSS